MGYTPVVDLFRSKVSVIEHILFDLLLESSPRASEAVSIWNEKPAE